MSNPLAEVFGFPIVNESEPAKLNRNQRLCPFNNVASKCTKTRADDPLGVCSVYDRGKPVITCPVRFTEDWLFVVDAPDFFFKPDARYRLLRNVRLKRNGGLVGNIDNMIILFDDEGEVLDCVSLEIQAVFISGDLYGPFRAYLENPTSKFDWGGVSDYPSPDYFLSLRKQLVRQVTSIHSAFKGRIKRAIAIQTYLFEQLPDFPEVSKEEANLSWFLYDLVEDKNKKVFRLKLNRIVNCLLSNSDFVELAQQSNL